jgi:predicted dehydrogenase
MPGQRFKVGIVGVQPGRSWAARAHIPALCALSETFEIVGVANTSLASAQQAATATGLPRAFADVAELIAAPEVDIVAVTVKVPAHFEIVKAAIGAGKHVYCEWPLGNGLAEAEELAALARDDPAFQNRSRGGRRGGRGPVGRRRSDVSGRGAAPLARHRGGE